MISSLQKDQNIKNVLSKLFENFGESNFYLTDYWDDDLCAIGIKSFTDKKYLIYISTFNLPTDLYFVEVEKANSKTDLTDYDVIEKLNNVNFDKLSEIITKYLKLQPIL